MNRKRIFFLTGILVSLVCGKSFAEGRETFQIGAMLCQTGNCSDWGSAALKGALLAQEEVNAAGGVLSKRIELVVEDTAESVSGAQAVTAFQNLLGKKIRFFIGPSWSPAALAIAPIAAKRSDLAIITPSASAPAFSRSAPHLFNVRPPEELATRSLARYAFNQGKRRAAIFSSQQSAESAQGRIFEDEFKKLGGEITIRIETVPTQTDLRVEALRVVKTAPDAVFLMNYNQIETGSNALNSLDYRGMRLAISLDDARVGSAQGLLEGVIISRAPEPTERFRGAFRERFREPPGLSAEGGYDAVMLIAQSIRAAGSFDVEQVREKLQHLSYSGATGALSFDENREVVQAPELFVVRDGKLMPLSETFKVGVLLPLTGPVAEYGVATQHGFELAKQEDPARFKNVQFLFDDTQYDSNKTVSSLQKLRLVDGISTAFVWGYGPSQAVAPLVERQRFPLISVSGERSMFRGKRYNYFFSYSIGSIAEELLKHLRSKNLKHLGVVKTELAYHNGLIEELRKRLQPGESLTVIDTYQLGDSDFKSTLAKLRSKKFDALGVFLVSGQISQFYRELRQHSLHFETFGTDFFDSMKLVQDAQGSMTGAVFAAPYVEPSFVTRYVQAYGDDVQVAWAAMGYEFAKLSAKLYGSLNEKLSADELLRRFATISGNQGTASRFTFEESSDGSGFDFTVATRRVEADRIVDVTQTEVPRDAP